MTTFLVYAPIPPADLQSRLGQPEYSYRFVLRGFQPALERLGHVVEIHDPATEVDPVYDECVARGEDCVFLCFAPPHRAPTGLRCPTSTVFAWEFETIPDHAWAGEEKNDWRTVLADHGRAIVLSQHTAAAVRRSMGEAFPVVAIPAALYDRFADGPDHSRPPLAPRSLTIEGTVVDSQEFVYTDDGMHAPTLAERFSMAPWDGEPIELTLTSQTEDHGCLVGFYRAEAWGTWSRVAEPWLILPVQVQGPVEIDLVAHGLGGNGGRRITATLGDDRVEFTLPRRRSHLRLRFDVTEPANVLQFAGLLAEVPPGQDQRTMGMGLSRLTVRRPSPVPPRAHRLLRKFRPVATGADFRAIPQRQTIALSDVVYTSVFNPVDYRKNWEQMLYAFCWAFRDEPRATLLLKMTHHSIAAFFADLQYFLHRVGPTACRVLVVQGYLPGDEYRNLTAVSTYYANASSAEGLCMPLMEFLSAGVPAVASDNTAMADYLDPDCAFVVRSTPAFTHWPHDDRQLIRALHHRVDWESLVAAFRASFARAWDDPDAYGAMSAAARHRMREFCADEIVAGMLAAFLLNEVPS